MNVAEPGLLSGVLLGFTSVSNEASDGGIVADLPSPFASRAASRAHFLLTEVMSILAIYAVKVSQNVSSMTTSLILNSAIEYHLFYRVC